ncbi:MAG: FkbM family methyltransferase [Candidatus Micrarchaeota archaeon]
MAKIPFSNLLHLNIPIALKVIRTVANWHIYSLDYLGLLPFKSVIYRLRNGLRFRLRPETSDRSTIDEVFVHGIYFRDETVIGENDIILDIGAHIGTFTAFASKAAKNGQVYSFEPDEDNFRLLKENIELNDIRNACAINAAVSTENGRKSFFVTEYATSAHSIYRPHGRAREVIVDAVTLADFVKSRGIKRIDLLKMDCEGSEYEIMLTCPKNVLEMVKRIAMECHNVPGHSADEIRVLLEENGFAVRSEDVPNIPDFRLLYAQRK